MLLPSNALALLLNSATSIWSSVTVVGLYCRGDLGQRVAALTSYWSPARGARGVGAVAVAAEPGARRAAARRRACGTGARGRDRLDGRRPLPVPGGSSRNV